jgi:hypothetical protein
MLLTTNFENELCSRLVLYFEFSDCKEIGESRLEKSAKFSKFVPISRLEISSFSKLGVTHINTV